MNCTDNYIELGKYLEAMLRVDGVLQGLPIVEVEGHEDQAISCDNNHLNFEDFVKLSIGVDSCDKPALRVKIINTCDSRVNCENSHDKQVLRTMFAYDSTLKTYALVINRSS